jgi:hypothetical protein
MFVAVPAPGTRIHLLDVNEDLPAEQAKVKLGWTTRKKAYSICLGFEGVSTAACMCCAMCGLLASCTAEREHQEHSQHCTARQRLHDVVNHDLGEDRANRGVKSMVFNRTCS